MELHPRSPVLVIDGHADSRQTLTSMLKTLGLSVIDAKNGVEAHGLMREHHPWLVFLDLTKPDLGEKAFRELQLADPEHQDILFVVVSNHRFAPAIADRMRADAWLLKPVEPFALADVIDRLTRVRGTPS